jgi:membrane-associated phospholipid phosphatase
LNLTTAEILDERNAETRGRTFRWVALVLGASHLAFAAWGGLRPEHVIADGLIIVLPWVGPKAYAFVRGALPLWLAGVLVDCQRYMPMLGPIHTGSIWRLDALMFPGPGGQPWPAYFDAHPVAVLDFFAGFGYAVYLYQYFAVALFFFFAKDPRRFESMGWAFLVANAAGAVLYMLFPAAPPWYVLQYGPGPAVLDAAPSAAGCARFDAMLGISYFQSFYSRNPNVFGAMPSMHVAYPLMATLYTWHRGRAWRIGGVAFTALICFAAVYLAHHYIVDVVVGLIIAVVTYVWAVRRISIPLTKGSS